MSDRASTPTESEQPRAGHPAILVRYRCKACGIGGESPSSMRGVAVPSRKADEDIKSWIDATARLAYHDHRRQSPQCKSLIDLAIPFNKDGEYIGEPIKAKT